MVRHLSFDYWQTLVTANPEYRVRRAALIADFTGGHGLEAEINRAYKLVGDRYNRDAEQDLDYKTPLELMAEMLETCGLSAGHDLADLRTQVDAVFLEYPPVVGHPDLEDYLAELKDDGITISITSNTAFTAGSVIRQMLDAEGLLPYFDFQLFSDEEKAAKPVKRLFEKVYTLAQMANPGIDQRAQVLHIGDNHLTDIQGAEAYGFQALWLEGPHELKMTLAHVSQVIRS